MGIRPKRKAQADGRRSRKAKASHRAGPSVPFQLVGGMERGLSRVARDTGDPVREAALEQAVKYVHCLSTMDLIAILPVLVKYSTVLPDCVDPGPPPGGDSA